AGLPHIDGMATEQDLYDWPGITAWLAAQATRWAPGTQAGYHSLSQGFLLGEVIRRVTGRRPAAFFAQEGAGPLGADVQFTLAAADDGRFAAGIAPPGAPADWRSAPLPRATEGAGTEAGTGSEAADSPAGIRLSVANSPAWRRAEIPSGSGYGNA